MSASRKSSARDRLMAARPVRASPEDLEQVARALPEGCPVQPLGMAATPTPTAVYLSGAGVVSHLSGQAHGQGNLEGLFAPFNTFLWEHWPRLNKKAEVDGFKAELVRADLMSSCGALGIWDEMDRVRGRGAWRAGDGSLLLHLGDRLLHGGAIHRWGVHDRLVYPAGPAMLGPAPEPQPAGLAGPAAELLATLQTWNWRHPQAAPRLLLGWIGVAMIGGALKWRPAVWPTGGTGTGKSTLIQAIKDLLGPQGSMNTAQSSAAAVRQVLGAQTVPTLLDELEPSDTTPERVQAIVELLRLMSSGATAHRGGADHQARSFTLRSAPMATSILVPPLPSQDRTRIAILDLAELPEDAAMPDLSTARMNLLGQRILRRMLDNWASWDERLATWRAQLKAHAGLNDRAQDQYGTLLAAADAAMHDGLPDAELLEDWVGPALRTMLGEMRADDETDWRRALDHLLTAPADSYRGGDRMTVGELVARAAGQMTGGDEEGAQRALWAFGLRVELKRGSWWLYVANQHQALSRVYGGSIWAGRSNTTGGWRQVLLRVPGAEVPASAIRFGSGHQQRAVAVPLHIALNQA